MRYRIMPKLQGPLTQDFARGRYVKACVVWLNVGFLDFAVFNDEGVALAARAAEDGGAVEGEVERVGEFGFRVG
jgi:hypothetical protein